MKLNFFKKEKNGWEFTDLIDALRNQQTGLMKFVKSYPLSVLNSSKDRFVIIRKFAAREFEGKIEMLNVPDFERGEHYPISHYGMTLVSFSEFGASSHNVILPNSLKYSRVELNGETISIHHSDGITTTNFVEVNCLWTIKNLEAQEILNKFRSLKNAKQDPQTIERHTAATIEDSFWGQLSFDEALDWYETIKDGIKFSFTTTLVEQLAENLRKTEKLLGSLSEVEGKMIDEMIPLKNQNWLEDEEKELSGSQFQKEIQLYSITINKDGSAELYYKANNLFWGHEIKTSISNNHHYKSSTLIG